MAREFKKYGRGEFDSEIKVRKDGPFVLWEDVAPYIMEENGSSHNRQITPCLTCRFFVKLSGCTVQGDCLGYESRTA